MYSSILSGSPAVERVWLGDSIVDPIVGHRSDPLLNADLVFTFVDGSCAVALQGPVTRRLVYPFREDAQYVGVRFRPGTGSVSAEAAVAEICDDKIPVTRLAGLDLEALCDALSATPHLVDKGRLVQDAVHRSVLSTRSPSPLVAAALARFNTGVGEIRVGQLAADLGVTERTLQRHFHAHLGISPKHAARLLRIERLKATLDRPDPPADWSLAVLASTAGYFDQSHMTNDVARILGITPTTLASERCPQPEV